MRHQGKQNLHFKPDGDFYKVISSFSSMLYACNVFDGNIHQAGNQGTFLSRLFSVQYLANIPMLFAMAAYIRKEALKKELKTVVFCSRDCKLLKKVFDFLYVHSDSGIKSDYIRISRLALARSSPEFCDYFIEKVDSNSLLVDLCGTARSLGAFYEFIGHQPWTLYLHFLDVTPSLVASSLPSQADPKNFQFVFKDSRLNNVPVELANYTLEFSVQDMTIRGGRFVAALEWAQRPTFIKRLAKVNELAVTRATSFVAFAFRDSIKSSAEGESTELPGIIRYYYLKVIDLLKNESSLLDYHLALDKITIEKIETLRKD